MTKNLSNSLYLRTFALAATGFFLTLFLTGLILVELYTRSVVANFDERLKVYINEIVADIVDDVPPREIEIRSEPRFQLPLSGWYWVIRNAEGIIINESASLSGEQLPPLFEQVESSTDSEASSSALTQYAFRQDKSGNTLRQVERILTYNDRRFIISVTGNEDEIQSNINAFQRLAYMVMFLVGILLCLMTFLLVYLALTPIARMRRALSDVRKGKSKQLTGHFPLELDHFIKELNALIVSNSKIVERARTQAGNLAHALKIPLSILLNDADKKTGDLADTVREQAGIINHQVSYHLDRAQIAARSQVLGAVTQVKPSLLGLIKVFERLNAQEGQISYRLECDEELSFRGDQQDFEEIMGNLIDNASKWATSCVKIRAFAGKIQDKKRLVIHVDDDGPGLTEAECQFVLDRGARLDKSKAGSGLGLSIVAELVDFYNGHFILGPYDERGLRCILELPILDD